MRKKNTYYFEFAFEPGGVWCDVYLTIHASNQQDAANLINRLMKDSPRWGYLYTEFQWANRHEFFNLAFTGLIINAE